MKLRISGLEFSYEGLPVLEDVSFTLGRGSIMCLLGINGAGKSTLLKCINRILKPKGGVVLIDGMDIRSMGQDRIARIVGYVPQRSPENAMTVLETVIMGRRPHLKWTIGKNDYGAAEAVIHQMGISHLAMRPLSSLSGGELQKTIIARALVQGPDVLLLDEPTSSLDLKSQLEVMSIVRSMTTQRGLSTIVAIHDINISLRYGDVFMFIKDRRIHAAVPKENLDAALISSVYGVDVVLAEVAGKTVVVPLGGDNESQ